MKQKIKYSKHLIVSVLKLEFKNRIMTKIFLPGKPKSYTKLLGIKCSNYFGTNFLPFFLKIALWKTD